jgi:hypothetical protein
MRTGPRQGAWMELGQTPTIPHRYMLVLCGDEDNRDWKRRSKGRRAGLGLTRGDPRSARGLHNQPAFPDSGNRSRTAPGALGSCAMDEAAEDHRAWKRRSKGRRAGLGLTRGDPRSARGLLLKEDGTEPRQSSITSQLSPTPETEAEPLQGPWEVVRWTKLRNQRGDGPGLG